MSQSGVIDFVRSLPARVRWHLNRHILRVPALLSFFGTRLTIIDTFAAPGDTLLAAIVCRNLKRCFPSLKINCITQNPALLQHDPNIDTLNAKESYFALRFWYLDLILLKDGVTNVLKPTFDQLRLKNYEYRARVYLTAEELKKAEERLAGVPRPFIAFNVVSKEKVKMWPLASWQKLIERLKQEYPLVHLGDDREPMFEGVTRFAGNISPRESMAILSSAAIHIGPDSFLMHAANGLDVPSVIIFGGSRKPANLGYAENENLASNPECSPCWLHDSRGDHCPYDIKCMQSITPETVAECAMKLLGTRTVAVPQHSPNNTLKLPGRGVDQNRP
jgi:ADP-heptose:LPS heptosyltransferase